MFDKQLTFVNKTFKDKADAINFLIHEAAARQESADVLWFFYVLGQVMMLQNPLWLYLQ